jgi:prepilin-type N-terminal cleavage/methylation domain-containing protein
MKGDSPLSAAARHARGFTVIELMTVVIVAAVLLAWAVPSLREFAARQRVKSVNAELVTDVQFARSESVARKSKVAIGFRVDDANLTCYTIYDLDGTAGAQCDCRKPLGTACDGVPDVAELKTVQVLRSTSVTLQPPEPPDAFVTFEEPRGLSNRNDFRVAVLSSISGKLRTSTNAVGRPQVCSPDGSIGGVSRCAD